MSDTTYTVRRYPDGLSGSYSDVGRWAHTYPHIARERAISHCKRLARADASLSHPATYAVIDTGGQIDAYYPPELKKE